MAIPEDMRYTEDHLWIKGVGGSFRCGITGHAQELLGDIEVVDLPEAGTAVGKGEKLLTLESLKSAFDIMSPAALEVTESNGAVKENPSLINASPFGEGWLLRFACDD
ncbi:MAG: glycine cleavage system protein H, partial [Spirochaetales bacterium]|nr:glycine cleavage system protein H [Spirochaetales bacterium]